MAERDFARVSQLEKQIFTDAWLENDFETALSVKDQYFIVAEILKDGQYKVVGYSGMWVIVDNGEIMNVAVDPEYRRLGIGRRMMTELIREGSARGAVTFGLEVRESNGGARRLYEELGFEVVGRRKSYYSHPTEDAILMTKA